MKNRISHIKKFERFGFKEKIKLLNIKLTEMADCCFVKGCSSHSKCGCGLTRLLSTTRKSAKNRLNQ